MRLKPSLLSGPFDVGRLEAAVPTGARHGPYGTPELAGVAPFFAGRRRDAWLSPSYANAPVADPAAAFGQIGAWVGEFMAEHVRDAN